MDAASEQSPELMTIRFTDWEHTRHANLAEVVPDATVAEVLDEARRVMDLPIDTSYQAVLHGRELNHMDTLRDAGIESGMEVEIIPEVHAG